ncbi:MAG: sugar transferase [Chloroflexi bacterium]|nr:sugar transferase [Chloroflexota bacterium]
MSGERIAPINLLHPATSVAAASVRTRGILRGERRLVLIMGDLAALSLALVAVLWAGFPGLGIPYKTLAVRPIWWPVLWAIWLPLATTIRCYEPRRIAVPARSAATAALLAGFVSVVYLVVPIISAPLTLSRIAWLSFSLVAMTFVAAWRLLYGNVVTQRLPARRVLMVGAGASGAELAKTIAEQGAIGGVNLVGFVDDDPELLGSSVENRPVLGDTVALPRLVETQRIDEIIVASDGDELSETTLGALSNAWGRGVRIVPVQIYYEELTGAVMVQHLGQDRFMLMSAPDLGFARLWDGFRRFVDIVVGVLGGILVLPFVPLIALAIRLDSRGPIFYFQQRVGQAGRLFRLAKFRSMVPDAERSGAVWCQQGDSRITRVGHILRKTRLDELPQLWNPINGSMTLIGPRPERPEFVRELTDRWPCYTIRHSVKPGLTGWAQVKYRYGSTVDDAMIKLQYDLYYVKHRGPFLDLVILLNTVRVILAFEGL